MVDKLEACTWCGHEGVLHSSSDGEVEWVRCVHCGRESPLAYSAAEAIQRWNAGEVREAKPTPTEDARERVKVLEEALRNAPIPGRNEEMMAFRERQDRWLAGPFRSGLGNKETDRHG